jgi:hypothetical protein
LSATSKFFLQTNIFNRFTKVFFFSEKLEGFLFLIQSKENQWTKKGKALPFFEQFSTAGNPSYRKQQHQARRY